MSSGSRVGRSGVRLACQGRICSGDQITVSRRRPLATGRTLAREPEACASARAHAGARTTAAHSEVKRASGRARAGRRRVRSAAAARSAVRHGRGKSSSRTWCVTRGVYAPARQRRVVAATDAAQRGRRPGAWSVSAQSGGLREIPGFWPHGPPGRARYGRTRQASTARPSPASHAARRHCPFASLDLSSVPLNPTSGREQIAGTLAKGPMRERTPC